MGAPALTSASVNPASLNPLLTLVGHSDHTLKNIELLTRFETF
jgi:hypothetical protein